ncbi:MAG: quinolinate synthase NadA [bacterium]
MTNIPTPEDSGAAIEAIRKEWGGRLLILGHHYQDSGVLRHADVIGDSLELARAAARATAAERIVFCGVRFMAESADILSQGRRSVYMPAVNAGCPMADMADITQVERAWRALTGMAPDWLPVAYVNSSAEIKAFCGRQGGLTCTSSNAGKVFEWVFKQQRRVFFLPDEHLGANTAHDLGLADVAVRIYDQRVWDGGLTAEGVKDAQVIVWKGFCPIHMVFSPIRIREIRQRWAGAKIIVHPETPKEIVRLTDAHGSTAQIIRYVAALPRGATVFVGTEAHLVRRLADEHQARGVNVQVIAPSFCPNMAKTNLRNLLALLRDWPDAARIKVPSATAGEARTALERMLALG